MKIGKKSTRNYPGVCLKWLYKVAKRMVLRAIYSCSRVCITTANTNNSFLLFSNSTNNNSLLHITCLSCWLIKSIFIFNNKFIYVAF